MRILIAPDKFKGSLSASQAAEAIRAGFAGVFPDACFDVALLADGGEGTVDVFSSQSGAGPKRVFCRDALGRNLNAEYVWIPEERLAVIEMSAASGLVHIGTGERDILHSTTFGTGEMIREALALSPETIAVGLGGSATNDAGAGMASALGWVFLDRRGQRVEPMPGNLRGIVKILPPPVRPATKVIALCDVKNPLLGERGCSRVYAPQKGATDGQVGILESHLEHFADVCEDTFGKTHRNTPGAGAAGGTGFGLLTFCNAEIVPGFDWVAEHLDLGNRMAACDLAVTGEGSIDLQTLEGKGPAALAALAGKHGKPCIAFAGRIENGAGRIFSKCFQISDPAIGLAENLSRGAQLLRSSATIAARTLLS